jgi:hypothetical protein
VAGRIGGTPRPVSPDLGGGPAKSVRGGGMIGFAGGALAAAGSSAGGSSGLRRLNTGGPFGQW